MLFNIPASHTAVLVIEPPLESFSSMVPLVFEALGWPFSQTSSGFKGQVRTSIWSWGEVVEAAPGPANHVVVSSRCSFPLQIVDWGKNRQNTEAFAATLANLSGRKIVAGV